MCNKSERYLNSVISTLAIISRYAYSMQMDIDTLLSFF